MRPDPRWDATLRAAKAVFASDLAAVPELEQRLGRPVRHLAPAFQPLLQNPIGFWAGDDGPHAAWESDLPPAWANGDDAWSRAARMRRVHRDEALACRLATRRAGPGP